MIYVALLRGINVGGKNAMDMKKLKATFESLGFTHVITYINSGNIIFETPATEPGDMINEIEKAILQDFRLEIKVILRSLENIGTICHEVPATWVRNEVMRTDVMFLWEPYDRPDIVNQLKINEVDTVRYLPGAILWHVEASDYSRSGMTKLIGTALYKNMTIRNVNTVRKIHEIMRSIAE